jgi:hypothetical protein
MATLAVADSRTLSRIFGAPQSEKAQSVAGLHLTWLTTGWELGTERRWVVEESFSAVEQPIQPLFCTYQGVLL